MSDHVSLKSEIFDMICALLLNNQWLIKDCFHKIRGISFPITHLTVFWKIPEIFKGPVVFPLQTQVFASLMGTYSNMEIQRHGFTSPYSTHKHHNRYLKMVCITMYTHKYTQTFCITSVCCPIVRGESHR